MTPMRRYFVSRFDLGSAAVQSVLADGDEGDEHEDDIGGSCSDGRGEFERDFFDRKMCVKVDGGRGVCTVLPACWGEGGAGCRRTTSAPPPELGSASQTASPAPAPRPAGRPYSHTAPFTR